MYTALSLVKHNYLGYVGENPTDVCCVHLAELCGKNREEQATFFSSITATIYLTVVNFFQLLPYSSSTM